MLLNVDAHYRRAESYTISFSQSGLLKIFGAAKRVTNFLSQTRVPTGVASRAKLDSALVTRSELLRLVSAFLRCGSTDLTSQPSSDWHRHLLIEPNRGVTNAPSDERWQVLDLPKSAAGGDDDLKAAVRRILTPRRH
jgi:hypothetical protein